MGRKSEGGAGQEGSTVLIAAIALIGVIALGVLVHFGII